MYADGSHCFHPLEYRTDEQPWSLSNSLFVGQRSAPVIALAILLWGDDLQQQGDGPGWVQQLKPPGCL